MRTRPRGPLAVMCVLSLTWGFHALPVQGAPTQDDAAWIERIDTLVLEVESRLHELDDRDADATAEIPSRLRALDDRLDTLEHRYGIAPGNLYLYEGDNAQRRLESWTHGATTLLQRSRKVAKAQADAILVAARERRARTQDDGTVKAPEATGGCVAGQADRTTEPQEKVQWVQSYNPTTGITTVAVLGFQVGKRLWHEVSIQFKHDKDVDIVNDNPQHWTLVRLVSEAELQNKVHNVFVDRDPDVSYPDEGDLGWAAGVLEERVEIGTRFRKDSVLADFMGKPGTVEVLTATWASGPYRKLIKVTWDGLVPTTPSGTLDETDIVLTGKALETVVRLMVAFDLRDMLAQRDAADGKASHLPAPAASGEGSSSGPAAAASERSPR